MLTDIAIRHVCGTCTTRARATDERERELYNRSKLRISRASQIKAGTDVITDRQVARSASHTAKRTCVALDLPELSPAILWPLLLFLCNKKG